MGAIREAFRAGGADRSARGIPGQRWLASLLLLIAASVVPSPAPAQSPPGSFVNFESGHVRPLALSPDGTRLFAVNTPDGRLAVFDVSAAGLTLAAEVPVGLEPVAVAARSSTEAWVVNHLSDSVSIVTIDTGNPALSRVTRTLHTCDEPRDIVFAGPGSGRAFITAARRGQNCPVAANVTTPGLGRAIVQVFDAANLGAAVGGTPIANLVLFGDTPRALARSADGTRVWAAVFHSGNGSTTVNEVVVSANGGLPPPPPGALAGGPPTGLIVRKNTVSGLFEDEIGRDWTPFVPFGLPDQDVFEIDAMATPPVSVGSVSGVGTILFNMAVNPVNGRLYVSNTEARNEVRFEGIDPTPMHGVKGHIAESRITIVSGATATPRHLNPHIDYFTVPGPAKEVDQSLAFPVDMAITSDGTRLYVAGFGSGAVGVLNTTQLDAGLVAKELIDVGGGPSGLALDEARDRLYVMNRFTHRVGIVTSLSDSRARAQTDSASLRFDPSPPEVRLGRRVLYDAKHTSAHGDSACASCHIFGDFDSLAWDLGDASPGLAVTPNPNPFRTGSGTPFHPLKGPMTTQSLRGMADAGPMHWRGDRTGGTSGGDPLDEDAAFRAFNPAFVGLLGREDELPDAEMQAFTDFILTVAYPPNPLHALDDVPTAAESAGATFFLNNPVDGGNTCEFCHRLPFGTDGFSSVEGEPQEFKVAHLRNLYQKVGMFGFPAGVPGIPGTGFVGDQVRGFGMLHDGSVATVFLFLNANAFNFGTTPNVKRRNVEAFVLGLDTGLAAVVGQQVSATSTTFSDAGVVARIGLLIARADAGDCDLIAKGVVAGEARGTVYVGGGSFRTDRASDPLVPAATLRGFAATSGQEQVYSCLPPGSGQRAGIDRDGDGRLDRDEIDAGSDPADPTSFPGSPAMTTVQTTSLSLRDDSVEPINAARRSLTFRSSTRTDPLANRITPPVFGATGDPTLEGATLRVYNSAGSGEQVTVTLPAGGWSRVGSQSYRFKGGDPANGPVQSVDVKADLIKIKAGKSLWSYTLDEPAQGRIAVRLTLGSSLEWCADAGAKASGRPPSTARNDKQDRFVAKTKTPAPVSCPAPPAGSPSGAFLDGEASILF